MPVVPDRRDTIARTHPAAYPCTFAADSWSVALEALPIEPRHARAFAYDGRLAVLSTHDAAAEAHLVLVTPATASPGPRASARRAPRRP